MSFSWEIIFFQCMVKLLLLILSYIYLGIGQVGWFVKISVLCHLSLYLCLYLYYKVLPNVQGVMVVSKLLYSFHIPLSLLLASVKQNQRRVPRCILQAVRDEIQPQVCQQGGLCLGTSNSQQITLKVTLTAICGSVGSSWLQREVSGHFLFTYWVVGFFYYYFLTRFLGTSCWLNREDCYCHWEGRKPVCLHCWVRKTSESSCCPVSWHDENPYGYKSWNH